MACPTLSTKAAACGMWTARRLKLWTLMLSVLAFSPMTGCTHFQTVETSKWFDVGFLNPGADGRANHILVRWDNRVRITQDSENGGKALAGMAGRIYLLNDMTGSSVDATGRIVVQMNDMTNLQPGQTPHCIAEWTFDPVSLKRLKRSDGIGEGYTVFLPWESYHPGVKTVQLRVAYVADEKQNPFFADPSLITLHTEEQAPPVIQERVVPATNLVPKR